MKQKWKQKWKQIGSLMLSVCMVLTMLPTAAFAEEGGQNSDTPSSTSKITAFTDLAEDVVLQEVEFGTILDELNLPSVLTATVTTGSVITATVSGWSSNPAYDGDKEGGYIFTPTLNLPNDTTLADGVTLPQITVTVKAADTPMLLGAGIQPLGTGINITGKFTDANFLAEVRKALKKGESDPIYDTDVDSVKNLLIGSKKITSLAGIQYFTELGMLTCSDNKLTELDVSKNTKLTDLTCSNNKLTKLDVSKNTKLTKLTCSDNQLTELDVSSSTKLTKLSCSNNQLTELDVSSNTALTDLTCKNNQLTELDMSKNTALQILNCNNNQLTELGVSSNTELTNLNCYDNQLIELDVSKSTKLALLNCNKNRLIALDVSKNTVLTKLDCSYNCIPKRSAVMGLDTRLTTKFTFDPQNSGTPTSNDITTIFKDANFLAEVRTVLKRGKNDRIYDTDDFAPVTYLALRNKNIKSLEGIEYFTELTTLSCSENYLIELDVSKNTKLETLDCSKNQLTALDVSSNTTLTTLACSTNQLTKLDVSSNTVLTNLNCSTNQLTALDVSSNTALTKLECYTNQLTTLDVSKNIKLEKLECYTNQLTTLDVSDNAALSNLNCHTNQLTKLDVSSNTALTKLDCLSNQLTALDVSKNIALDLLSCSSNQLTALDVSKNTALTLLYCNYNMGLTALDVSKNTMLIELSCSYTGLTALGVSKNTVLTKLGCSYTGLTALDVSKNTVLSELSCNGNQLSALDVSKNTALSELWCYSNQLTALDVSKNTALTTLNCSGNYIPDDSVITGLDKSLTTNFTFDPQNPTRNDITANFKDANFLAIVRLKLNKNQSDPIYDTDNFASVTTLRLSDMSIASLEGIEYFTDITELYCSGNQLSVLDVSQNTALTTLDCSRNYMPDDSVITGLDKSQTTNFTFDPQNSSMSTYAVTVNSGTASSSTAMVNAIVTIVADAAPSGKRFKEWTVVSGGVTLVNSQAASTTFTMPAKAVNITATYEDIQAGVTQVTGVTLNKTDLSLYSNTSTKTANLTATITPADATDKSVTWQSSNTSVATVDESGKVTAVGNGTATITVITTDGGYTTLCNVMVSTYTSGGSGGGSSSGGSSPANTATIKENQPNQPITAVSSVTATVGTNGKASAPIPDKAVTDAISKAQAEVSKQKKTENGISIGLNVTMPKGATTLTATLSKNALNSLVSAGVTNLEINGSPVTISFDQKALTEIQKQTSGNVNIAITSQEELSETAKAIIGTRPVYNITVSYGNNSTVSSFGEGGATIAIPYTPANGEVISGLYAVYVDENGNATRVEGSAYDANSGSVLFTTPHFSMYGVGYTSPSEKLTDISNHWAKESIDYVVDKGMIDGATETTFAPDTFMTRGTLVTALGRLTGKDVSSYTTSSFTDVEAGSTSQPYIEWAYEEGMIHGIGNDEFAPERAITREEIAVIIANFTKATGYTLPVNGEATAYTDASSIGDYYKTAITAMQQAGIMTGGTGNKFNPKSNATRAEVSSMLHRYIKLIVD